jgi:outer membrane protein OmpA-like peptidoglycan-associated protein
VPVIALLASFVIAAWARPVPVALPTALTSDIVVRQPTSANDVAQIMERISFAYDSAELTPASAPQLDAIAGALKVEAQHFPLVALEGHAADNEHAAMRLSLARASVVRVALLARGVGSERLLARASGATAPSCREHNETCWARERTVEFLTLTVPKTPSADGDAARGDADEAQPPPAKPAPAEAAAPLARIEFQRSSAVMAPAVLGELDLVAGFMKANPVSVEIVGYADSAERRAAALAQARADAVRAYMMACGVSREHIATRTELTARAACPSRSATCPARKGRAELRFVDSSGR